MNDPTDVLILNTAVLDLRSADFAFANELVGPGGLAKCETRDMPAYTPEQYRGWIAAGGATAGGPGNTAPLIARAGLRVAVGVNLGAGPFGGLDIQGRTFHDILRANGVDMSATCTHPTLPTGTTYIYEAPGTERGGIAYFPNANNDFDFARFRGEVARLRPRVVYYMYSGLSDRGDANGGRDLAAFMAWCRAQGCITIVDSHTLCGNPQELIRQGQPVEAYRLLLPLLPEVDIFFTSADEARMIGNTLDTPGAWSAEPNDRLIPRFLAFLRDRFAAGDARCRLFGVTVATGAYALRAGPGPREDARLHASRFMAGEVIDLVGAGDSFRAGLISHVARNADAFRAGTLDTGECVQMGNLMACLFIKSPLHDRYGNIRPYERLLDVVRRGKAFDTFAGLMQSLGAA